MEDATRQTAGDAVRARTTALVDLHTRRANGEQVFTGVPTGFKTFDAEYGGLPRTVVVLGADTGLGKSAFAQAFAEGAVKSGAGDVYLGNLEDGNDNLADRILGRRTGFGATRIRKLDFEVNDRARLVAAGEDSWLERVVVDDTAYEVSVFCDRVLEYDEMIWQRYGRRVVLAGLDYVQLARVKGITNNTERIMNALLALQGLSKALKGCVLALSQLTTKKVMERGQDHYQRARAAGETDDQLYEGFAPQRGDFHWASELDQFSKMTLGAFRPGPYKRLLHDGSDDDTEITLRVLKNNFGPQKRFRMRWNGPLTAITDL